MKKNSKSTEQKKSLKLTDKRKKLSEQKKHSKTKGFGLNTMSPSESEINSLLEDYQIGQYGDAEKRALSMTQQFPLHQFGWLVLGAVYGKTGRTGESLVPNQMSVQLAPQDAQAHYILGITLRELGKLSEAEASYTQAIALRPDYAEAHCNLGATLRELGRLDEAETSYTQAIALKPDYAKAHYNLANTLRELGRLEEAEARYIQAIALKPADARAHNNLGNILQDLGRLDKAEASYTKAIMLTPDAAEPHYNLGSTLQEQGKLKEAEASFKRAIALEPDHAGAHKNLSFTLLNSGRLEEGLDQYEWRWKVAKTKLKSRQFQQPVWDGQESLQGKRVLLWSEQGIGDTINWSSCLPLMASLAGHIMLECQEKIVSLLARSFPNIEIKPEDWSMDSEREDFDFHLPMGSLYRHFIPYISQNLNIGAYLIPNPVRIKFWRDRLSSIGKGPYVGISWKSSEVSPFRLKHYPPISDWSTVLTIPGITFINLQYTSFVDDLTEIEEKYGVTVHNFDDLDQYNDVDDVAALCAALDMVVSTKVTPMIFSSGVGTPTKVANWRQSIFNTVLTNPASSSVEMFHRDTWESWDNVFNSIAKEVDKLKNAAT